MIIEATGLHNIIRVELLLLNVDYDINVTKMLKKCYLFICFMFLTDSFNLQKKKRWDGMDCEHQG